jgi:hypothetical protein
VIRYARLRLDAGDKPSPHADFVCTEGRGKDSQNVFIPIELTVKIFLALISPIPVGPGRVLGRVFSVLSNRVASDTTKIGRGSEQLNR